MSQSVPSFTYSVDPHPVGVAGDQGILYGIDFQGLLTSENHTRTPKGGWSGGGPFYVHKESIRHLNSRTTPFRLNGNQYDVTTCGVVGIPGMTVSPSQLPDRVAALGEAQAYGLRGFNRTKPGRALVELFVGVKELYSDGLPSLPFRKAIFGKKNRWGIPTFIPPRELPGAIKNVIKDFRALGSEYLNVVFGWKPFVKDVIGLYNAMKSVDRALKQIKAQNGHSIRRRTTLRDDVSTSQTGVDYQLPYVNVYGQPPGAPAGTTSWSVTTTTKVKVWYHAGYRYWIPDTTSWQWDAKARLALFGLLPTPGRLWDALPWSWMVDWFTDNGEIADAISPTAVDNLVQLYGFTMMHDITTVQATASVQHDAVNTEINYPPIFGARWPSVDHTFISLYKRERKMRVGGFNPFGPSVSLDTLSGGQAAILAALGLTRLPR